MPCREEGATYLHADLLKAAAKEALIEGADGSVEFDANSFAHRVLQVSPGPRARMKQLVPVVADCSLALIAASGERASYRFFEFFTAQIAIRTRAAPMRARRMNSSPGWRRMA